MVVGERLKALRAAKNFSQGDIEKRTGLLRCYISRVENDHTVPSLETLEKFARAFDVPLYQMFYEGTETLPPPKPKKSLDAKKEDHLVSRFKPYLAKLTERDRDVLLTTARKMAVKAKR
jgi:transcriptional regulator with XRE-family HTH domain